MTESGSGDGPMPLKHNNNVRESVKFTDGFLLEIFESSPFGISIILRDTFERVYANRRFIEMLMGPNQPQGAVPLVLASLDSPDELNDRRALMEREGTVANVEVLKKRPDGTEWWDLVNWQATTFESQPAFIVWHNDITEHKKAEDDISESQSFRDTAIATFDHGFALWDEEQRLLMWNDQYRDFWGFPNSLFKIGTPLLDLALFCAERGDYGDGDIRELAETRVQEILATIDTTTERNILANGKEGRSKRHSVPGMGHISTVTDITEIAETERAARSLSAAINAFPEPVIYLDKEDKVVFTNDRYHQAFPSAPPKQEIVGWNQVDLLRQLAVGGDIDSPLARSDPEAYAKELCDLRQNTKSGGRQYRRFDGSTSMSRWTRLDDGSLFLFNIDITELDRTRQELEERTGRLEMEITERRYAESALRDNEERFRDMAESASDWLWEMGPDFRFTYLSHGFSESTGIETSEFIGKTRREAAGDNGKADDQMKWREHEETLAAHLPFKGFEYTAMGPDGESRHFRLNGQPIFDGSEKFQGYRGTASNITDQKRAEEALANSEARFRDIAELMSDWYWEMGPDLRTTYVSDRVFEIAGGTIDEIIGLTRAEFAGAEQIAENPEKWRQHEDTLQARQPFKGFEYWAINSDGSKRHMQVSGRPVFAADGDFVGYRGAGRDITERVQAQEVIAESEARLRTILEESPVGISIVQRANPSKRIYVNPAFVRQIGAGSTDELLAEPIIESLAETDDWREVESRIGGGEVHAGEVRKRKRADGSIWYCLLDTREIIYDGEACIIAWHYDISDRIEAEDALAESETRMRQILESSPVGVSIVTAEKPYRRLYANPRFVEMLGAGSVDSLLQRSPSESYVNPDDYQFIENVEARRGDQETIKQRQRSDGSQWWCLLHVNRIRYRDEDCVIGWHYDITERIEIEAALRDKTELVEMLRRTARDANNATSLDEAMRDCLADVCAYNSWPVGHAYVRDNARPDVLVPTDIWHLNDSKRFTSFVEVSRNTEFKSGIGLPGRVLKSGRPSWIVDVTKDKNFPRASLAADIGVRAGFAMPVLVGADVVAVLEFFAPDAMEPDQTLLDTLIHVGTQLGRVAEREQAEAALQTVNRELEQRVDERTLDLRTAMEDAEKANRSKSEFLANMSHELRTPLNCIVGFSEIMGDEMFGPMENTHYREYSQDIRKSSLHLLALISDILDFSKLEAGEMVLDDSECGIGELFADCAEMMGAKAEETGITFEISIADDFPCVNADALRLKQVILNLMANAVKFSIEGGVVKMSAVLTENRGITVVIADTGVGIASEDIPKTLEMFGQARDGATIAHEGAGLGLALAKSIIELHGGILSIDSEIGVGTTVTFSLPADRTCI